VRTWRGSGRTPPPWAPFHKSAFRGFTTLRP